MEKLRVRPIKKQTLSFTILGTSPLIQHRWAEKSKRDLREKHAGKKTKDREIRDPIAEAKEALYLTGSGKYGIPAGAIKKAFITAAHKDLGIEKTLVSKALFVQCKDANNVIQIECTEPRFREDVVRVARGSTDLRYRPEFEQWSMLIEISYDAELLTDKDILMLVDRAGFGVGLGEWRPERGGEYGRFEVDLGKPVQRKGE